MRLDTAESYRPMSLPVRLFACFADCTYFTVKQIHLILGMKIMI